MGEQEKLGRAPLSRGVRLKGNKKQVPARLVSNFTLRTFRLFIPCLYTLHYVHSNGKTPSLFHERVSTVSRDVNFIQVERMSIV